MNINGNMTNSFLTSIKEPREKKNSVKVMQFMLVSGQSVIDTQTGSSYTKILEESRRKYLNKLTDHKKFGSKDNQLVHVQGKERTFNIIVSKR